MKLKILTFGVARDIIGKRELILEVKELISAEELCSVLIEAFPALKEVMSFSVAINQEYALPKQLIHESDEIAIIPPVSGG